MFLHLRSPSLRAIAAAAGGAVAVGVLGGFGVVSGDSAPATDDHMDHTHQQMVDDGPDMATMHEQMMQASPEMARLHEQMMDADPDMARMHEQMMEDHGGGTMGGDEMPSMDSDPPG